RQRGVRRGRRTLRSARVYSLRRRALRRGHGASVTPSAGVASLRRARRTRAQARRRGDARRDARRNELTQNSFATSSAFFASFAVKRDLLNRKGRKGLAKDAKRLTLKLG